MVHYGMLSAVVGITSLIGSHKTYLTLKQKRTLRKKLFQWSGLAVDTHPGVSSSIAPLSQTLAPNSLSPSSPKLAHTCVKLESLFSWPHNTNEIVLKYFKGALL